MPENDNGAVRLGFEEITREEYEGNGSGRRAAIIEDENPYATPLGLVEYDPVLDAVPAPEFVPNLLLIRKLCVYLNILTTAILVLAVAGCVLAYFHDQAIAGNNPITPGTFSAANRICTFIIFVLQLPVIFIVYIIARKQGTSFASSIFHVVIALFLITLGEHGYDIVLPIGVIVIAFVLHSRTHDIAQRMRENKNNDTEGRADQPA